MFKLFILFLKLVQGRLEVTNYFSEKHRKATLVEQLIYLLDHQSESPVHNSTPIQRLFCLIFKGYY